MGTLMSNGRKVLMVFSRDGRLCTKTYTSDGKLAWELEGDILLKFAVDVAKGTTLFLIDSSTEVTANDDYKAGDYLYFSKGTFHPTRVRFIIAIGSSCNYYSEVRFLKSDFSQTISGCNVMFGIWNEEVSDRCVAKIIDMSDFDTSNVTNMGSMFCFCTSLTSLDVSNFDTSKVTNMSYMFYGCRNLTNLIFGSKWGTQTSTAANALTLDLHYLGSSKSYKLTDDTYNSMLTMYDRASNGLTTMTIKFSKNHNLPDGFAEKMSALGYTITLV